MEWDNVIMITVLTSRRTPWKGNYRHTNCSVIIGFHRDATL